MEPLAIFFTIVAVLLAYAAGHTYKEFGDNPITPMCMVIAIILLCLSHINLQDNYMRKHGYVWVEGKYINLKESKPLFVEKESK